MSALDDYGFYCPNRIVLHGIMNKKIEDICARRFFLLYNVQKIMNWGWSRLESYCHLLPHQGRHLFLQHLTKLQWMQKMGFHRHSGILVIHSTRIFIHHDTRDILLPSSMMINSKWQRYQGQKDIKECLGAWNCLAHLNRATTQHLQVFAMKMSPVFPDLSRCIRIWKFPIFW